MYVQITPLGSKKILSFQRYFVLVIVHVQTKEHVMIILEFVFAILGYLCGKEAPICPVSSQSMEYIERCFTPKRYARYSEILLEIGLILKYVLSVNFYYPAPTKAAEQSSLR